MKKRISKRATAVVVSTVIATTAAVLCAPSPGIEPQVVKLTGTTRNTINAPGERSGMIYSAAFALNGKTLASGDDRGRISLWDTTTNKLTTTLLGHKSYVDSLAWSPKGDQLLSVGQLFVKNSGAVDGAELKIWEVASGKPRFEMSWPDFYIDLAAWSPDGKIIALSGSKSEANKLFPQIELRDASSGKLLHTIIPRRDNKSINRLQFSPDSQLLLTLLHWECEGNLWDVASGKSVRELKPSPDLKIPFAADVFAFSPDSKTLARGRFDGSLILEEARSGELLRTFKKQSPFNITEVRFSPDGNTLWSLNAFNVFTWNSTTGELLSQIYFNAGNKPVLSADSTLIASYSNRDLYLVHLATKTTHEN